jgi:hypothetical protein
LPVSVPGEPVALLGDALGEMGELVAEEVAGAQRPVGVGQ